MSLAEDLQGKIEQTTTSLANLTQKLDELSALEESLREANGGLAQAGFGVSELIASARAAQGSLDATLKALEQAADVMMRLEPATITSAIQAADTSIKATVEGSAKELSSLVSEQAEAINQSISASHEVTQQQIREQASQHAERQAKDVKALKQVGFLTIFALAIVVVLALLIFIDTQ